MKIHPRIQEIISQLSNIPFEQALSRDTLSKLENINVTYAEAIVAIHQSFGIDIDIVAKFIRENNVFPIQDLTDYAYEIMLYTDGELS